MWGVFFAGEIHENGEKSLIYTTADDGDMLVGYKKVTYQKNWQTKRYISEKISNTKKRFLKKIGGAITGAPPDNIPQTRDLM